jgi:hypothetical protein
MIDGTQISSLFWRVQFVAISAIISVASLGRNVSGKYKQSIFTRNKCKLSFGKEHTDKTEI